VTITTTTPKACTTDSDCTASGDSCNNRCKASTTPCLDSTYSNAGDYPGYFKQTGTYCYSSKSNKTTCAYSGSYDEFDGNAVMPASCTYGGSASTTPYVCVNTTTDALSGKEYVNQFVSTGKFLNWLSMSKFDIEKGILTGGKYRTDMGGDIIGESRGCQGRKFVKTLPALPGISFGIRGGSAALNNTSQATQYGQTFIEIYKGTYNSSDCQAALNDWMNVSSANMGPLQVDTKNCIGGTGSISDKLAAANQTIHDCYWYFNGHGLTNLQPIKNVCAKVYQTTPAGDITDPNDPAAICSNSLSHSASLEDGNTNGFLGSCFTAGVWDDACALRENKDFCQAMGGGGSVADPSSELTASTSSTVQNVPGFVMELGLGSMEMLNDYTRLSPVPANATKGFALAVYDPWNFNPWPPTGLIQKYNKDIRFGVMTFANNGAGSECNQSGNCSATSTNPGASCTSDANCTGGGRCIFPIPCSKTCSNLLTRQCNNSDDCTYTNPSTGAVSTGTCSSLAKADGGVMVAYVGAGFCSSTTTTACKIDTDCPVNEYCKPSIGDHNSGLLRNIDDIQATSWTPFAEAYYNAMGYLARINDYSATPSTSRSDAGFSSLPSPNTSASYVTNKNPSQFRCQSNNVLLITDGMSTADKSTASESLASLYAPKASYVSGGLTYTPTTAGFNSANNYGFDSTNSCPRYSGSRSISTLSWVANHRNIKSLSTSVLSDILPATSSEYIITYVVYSGPASSTQPGMCNPSDLMASTAANGGTSLLAASNPTELNKMIDSALSETAAKAASGTAASILSNSEGSGANILQAVFYPTKIFTSSTGSTSVKWIGELQNLWYFVDPYIQNSTIREDTTRDLKLNLVDDNVVRFTFVSSQDKTMVQRYSDSNGDGAVSDSDKVGVLIDPDYIKSIWRAGMILWDRSDSGLTARTIYTGYNSINGATPTQFVSSLATSPDMRNMLNILPAATDTQRQTIADKLIKYVRGTDQPSDSSVGVCLNSDCIYRPRKVTIDICSNDHQRRCTTDADCDSGGSCTYKASEWKLGDIISSTPRVQSTIRLNTYNLPPPGGYNDKSYEVFINSAGYKGRGMVYAGANDGMLHAFNLGVLSVKSSGTEKASLSGSNLGKEEWAFIPKNSLPYLKYMTDSYYNHIYFNDGRTVLLDASIGIGTGCTETTDYWKCEKDTVSGSNWRTVVISGMGLGGASRDMTDSCTEDDSGTCVKTPVSGNGFSSYFALDVTDPTKPKFLWEFSNPNLGYSTSGPAIVRVGDKGKNGRWFAVFGNGPFGPIDSGSHQFKGESRENLRYFVVDLSTGQLMATINDSDTLGLGNAFSGALLGASIDADRRDTATSGNYQDDAIYSGYVKFGADGKWTDGGVIRIMTKESMDPTTWVASKVIDGIGPVTTSIARTQDTRSLNRNLWLYFGTGRYFYRDATTLDDYNNQRALFGIKEPCYNTNSKPGNFLDGSCTAMISGALQDQTSSIGDIGGAPGWKINLDSATTDMGAERVITDTVALTNGVVYFTSFKPTMDICGYGGNSFLWGIKYDTGGQAAANALQGKALIQLSTGEFREVDLSTAFTDKGGRRMQTPMTGKPPHDAPPIISNSQNRPVKKILHIQER